MSRVPRPTAFTRRLAALLLTVPSVAASGQIYRLPPPDTTSGNYFGTSVAVDGNRIVVGATGIDRCGSDSGSAYVYEPAGDGTWRLDAVLDPGDCEAEDFFGRAVVIDGDRIAVTAHRPYFSTFRSNAVHLFERNEDGRWIHAARIEAPADEREGAFAASIALSGERLLVTTSGDRAAGEGGGSASIYERQDDGRWTRVARLLGSSSPGAPAFGASCALDRDVAVVSASTYARGGPGTVFVFERSADGAWMQRARFGGIEDFFIPMALDGRRLLVGQRDAGRDHDGLATVYEPDTTGAWRLATRLLPPVPYPHGGFGSGVALSGDHALVVGFDEQLQFDFNIDRVVYVFGPDDSGPWSQRQIIDLGETHFGASIAADGPIAVIGAATDGKPGEAYVAHLH